jgi:hypothetical protein
MSQKELHHGGRGGHGGKNQKRLFSVSSVSSVVEIFFGLAIMIVSQAATLAHVEPFWSWNTPICWTGFILFADGIVFRARGDSWLRSAPPEFVLLALGSIPLWLVFEFFNRFIRNWYYVGLPENPIARYLGYAWAFATIWPALFEGAELAGVIRARSVESQRTRPARPASLAGPALPAPSAVSIAVGALMLLWPLLWPSPYLAAPVFLGFIFLLDPINARLGAESLAADLRAGRTERIINLSLSGLLCGFLWELWNYWARSKWHYSVPIMENLKLFEMPLPGYLGFPAFALECFTMYVFVRAVALRLVAHEPRRQLGRTIAL